MFIFIIIYECDYHLCGQISIAIIKKDKTKLPNIYTFKKNSLDLYEENSMYANVMNIQFLKFFFNHYLRTYSTGQIRVKVNNANNENCCRGTLEKIDTLTLEKRRGA